MRSVRDYLGLSNLTGFIDRAVRGMLPGLFLFFLFLGGCSTAGRLQGVGEGYTFEPGGKDGVVVISTAYTNETCNGGLFSPVANAHLERVGGGGGDEIISVKNALLTEDFPDSHGYLFVRKVPAGTYRFGALDLVAGGSTYFGRFRDFSAFKVAAGQVVYLGELTVYIHDCSQFRSKFEDRQARDRAMFEKRVPGLAAAPFVVEIPSTR